MDVASLAINVSTIGVNQASDGLKRLGREAQTTERSVASAAVGWLKATASLAAVATAVYKVVDAAKNYQAQMARLETATGSVERASAAYKQLQNFASTTPYGLQQTVDAFTQLSNLGLTAGIKELQSYGNTASAMGKSLSQLVEAVADATTGEFERLKEFGIKAASEGDRVTFTFRGVATEVGKNAAEIEQYLLNLGNTQFAGAMEKQMATLGGALAGLGDAWEQLLTEVGKGELSDAIESAVRSATGALEEMTALLQSGVVGKQLEAQAEHWRRYGQDIEDTLALIQAHLTSTTQHVRVDTELLTSWFTNLGTNLRTMTKTLAVELGAFTDRLGAEATFYTDAAKALFSESTVAEAYTKFNQAIGRQQDARRDTIQDIFNEREATLASYEAQKRAADEAFEVFKKQRAERRRLLSEGLDPGATDTPLSTTGPKAEGSTKPSKAEEREAAARAKATEALRESLLAEEELVRVSYTKRNAEIDKLLTGPERQNALARSAEIYRQQLSGLGLSDIEESLKTEEQKIQESYARRVEIVKASTLLEEADRDSLLQRLAEREQAELARQAQQREERRQSLLGEFASEEELLLQKYERQRQIILEATEVTEMERQGLLRSLEERYAEETRSRQEAKNAQALDSWGRLFNGIGELAKSTGHEQSKMAKAAFIASKASNLATAIISVQAGMAEAMKAPWPQNLAAAAQVAAQGAGIISTIRGTNYAGAYDKGGYIPVGKVGIVGEYGPEFVRGPARVTGREQTARARPDPVADNQVADNGPAVTIVNMLDPSVFEQYVRSETGQKAILNIIEQAQ